MPYKAQIQRALILCFILFIPFLSQAQQVADTFYTPNIPSPMFTEGAGPTVLLDEAHHNFHTINGRYYAFTKTLRMDGYVVLPQRERFSRPGLDRAKILVIANALAAENETEWVLPTPSAFDSNEIVCVREWVRDGGSLLLIADHMPFGGAAEELAFEFGIVTGNGFAVDINTEDGRMRFLRSDGSLADHPITQGRNSSERIDSVIAFMGEAIRLLGKGAPLMTLNNNTMLLMPEVAWQFSKLTPAILSGGMLQGAVLQFGKGKVAVFGEAAMFSAQVTGPNRSPMGMNEPAAPQNAQFLLNVLHWLSGAL